MKNDCCTFRDCGTNNVGQRTVKLNFMRSQLLYDIENYAYVESHIIPDENVHQKHIVSEIGEEGNVDRVSRIISVAHAGVTELLYPWTKVQPIEEEIDDFLSAPDVYTVELTVPDTISRTTMVYLSKLIHEYMVYKALADWMSITNPNSAGNWAAKAQEAADEIVRAKSTHKGVFTRKLNPF